MTLELKNRILYGALASLLVLITLIFLGEFMTLMLALAAALQGWREYSRMMGVQERKPFYFAGFPIIVMIFGYTYFFRDIPMFFVWLLWPVGFFMLFFEQKRARLALPGLGDGELPNFSALNQWSLLCRFVMGMIYIMLIFAFIYPIAAKAGIGIELILLGFAVVFGGDTGAYFVGKRFGKTKIWPEISPKKTREGAWGGLLGSVVGAILVWGIFRLVHGAYYQPLTLLRCLIIAFIGAPLAQASDFLESLMKRAANQKDSGTLIPGHGGILDRADGLAFFLPLLYYLF